MAKKSEGAITSAGDYDKISAEIEGAVNMVIEDDSTAAAGAAKKDTPEGAENPATSVSTEGQPTAFSVGDAEIERAVKAGMSVADARAFNDKDAFERVCAALEKGRGAPDGNETSENNGEGEGDGDADAADADIPRLPTDKDFDEELVSAFNKMGDMLKEMRKENRALKKAGKSAEAQTFFDQQLGTFDEAVRAKIDDAGKAKIRQKFEILERGYGKDSGMTREAIFKEAAELALGSLLREGAAAGKVAAIEKRKALQIAPPSGANRAGTDKRSEEDIDQEVAALIANKFNI